MPPVDTAHAEDPRARLRDPAYFALHLEATAAIRAGSQPGWYDSHFVRRLEVARRYLARVRPDALGAFNEGFAALKPAEGFRDVVIDGVFDAATHEAIVQTSRSAEIALDNAQAQDENTSFGRDVVWDHPFFLDLQEQVRGRVAELVGRPLVSSYNFLSRYGASGQCEVHMDHPKAMFTFDYCIEQDAEWPIHVSRVVDWPDSDFISRFDPARIMADRAFDFAERVLQPGQALVFNGSSQWHYRRPRTAGGFCHLLFFHYYPAGCEMLVEPRHWAEHFGIEELGPLCDLFARGAADGFA